MADAEFEVGLGAAGRRVRPARGGHRRAADRAERRASRRAAARDRLGGRAVAGDAGAAERRPLESAGGERRSRCWCSTRSTPGSAATPRERSASICARWPPAGRSSASPTCRRSRRWRSALPDRQADERRRWRGRRCNALAGEEIVGELVRMLGAGDGDRAASEPRARAAARPRSPLFGPHCSSGAIGTFDPTS